MPFRTHDTMADPCSFRNPIRQRPGSASAAKAEAAGFQVMGSSEAAKWADVIHFQKCFDVLIGIGGTPEGVLAACALRAMGGEIQGKLYARDDDELRRGKEAGYDFEKILTMDDLVSSEDVFFAATGITDGELLEGVKYTGDSARTESLVVRGLTGTVRRIDAVHKIGKLHELSAIKY